MSRTELVVQSDLTNISRNIAQMRKEKGCLEVRQAAIGRAMHRMEKRLLECDDLEEVQNLQDIVDNLCTISADLETYRSNLEIELDKVDRGVKTLSGLPDQIGRQAFVMYVAEDTELSVKNLVQVRLYYDQVVATLRRLADNQLS